MIFKKTLATLALLSVSLTAGNYNFQQMEEDCNFRFTGASCMKLGIYYIEERKEAKNGIEYLKKSCAVGSGSGCMAMGEIYRFGQFGTEKSPIEAKKYYHESCLVGFEPGCDAYNGFVLTAKPFFGFIRVTEKKIIEPKIKENEIEKNFVD